jgi:type II secretory pathway component PulF
MIKNNKIALSSWIYTAVYLLYGVSLYILVPKFTEIFKEMKIALPSPRGIVVSTPPIIWLLISCIVANLIIFRDISGKRSLFPNWAVLMILIISMVYFIWALFAPIFICGAPNI